MNHHPVHAGVFNKNKDKKGGASERGADSTVEPTPEPSTNEVPARPPAVVEAEARTARELSTTVGKLRNDLNTCNKRVNAIEEGFQSLYSAHLGNVDGLRKCQQGVLTPEELSKLHASLDKVNPALVEQAAHKEDERLRHKRTEELELKHRELIHTLEDQIESLIRREKSWERTISELRARRDLLEKRENAWERTIGDLMGDIEIRTERESWMDGMKKDMEGRIGALSKIAVMERFGPGPYYVSMTVLLDEGNPSSQREVIFELAPLDLMPHSIHLFLSQIAEGYWSRGTPAIAINADHVLLACPHPCLDDVNMGGSMEGYPYSEMRDAGLDVASFQEYSPKYPHEKYTIGFAGRPHSGPEFYINLIDNSLDHGTLEERRMKTNPKVYKAWVEEVFGSAEQIDPKVVEPYPCFGKVVKGFETIDEISKGTTRRSLQTESDDEEEDDAVELDENILLRPVKIATVSILKDYTPEPITEKEETEDSAGSDEL